MWSFPVLISVLQQFRTLGWHHSWGPHGATLSRGQPVNMGPSEGHRYQVRENDRSELSWWHQNMTVKQQTHSIPMLLHFKFKSFQFYRLRHINDLSWTGRKVGAQASHALIVWSKKSRNLPYPLSMWVCHMAPRLRPTQYHTISTINGCHRSLSSWSNINIIHCVQFDHFWRPKSPPMVAFKGHVLCAAHEKSAVQVLIRRWRGAKWVVAYKNPFSVSASQEIDEKTQRKMRPRDMDAWVIFGTWISGDVLGYQPLTFILYIQHIWFCKSQGTNPVW